MTEYTQDNNPLLYVSNLPNAAPPFDKIEESHYLPAVKSAIAMARENIAKIRDNPEPPTFENTVVALEVASEMLGYVQSIFYNQLSAAGTDALNDLAEKIGPLTSNFSSDILHDAALFARVQDLYDRRETLGLSEEGMMLLTESHEGFIRGGAALGEEGKATLRDISEKMSVLGPKFMDNAKKAQEAFELILTDPADISGLPDSITDAAKEDAKEHGHENAWRITLDFPIMIPFLQFADNRALREKVARAYADCAWQDDFDNTENIKQTLTLRDARAKLLGYENHAAFVLERRMAETAENVMTFVNRLKDGYRPAAKQDLDDLKAFAKERDGLDDFKPWDVAYYSEKLKEARFHYSSEDLRPYFPLDQVLDGALGHFAKLFGLRFEKSNAYPVWHKDVVAFDIHDERSDQFIGTLYGDFHPRTGKKNGAWMTSYREQGLFAGEIRRPVVAIVCNFAKPSADRPSLLTLSDVETLFHELGHAFHALLSDVTYASLAGTNVRWDFVELPSQVQENWVFEKETLLTFARHYKTGEPMPDDLYDKMLKAKNFMVGWAGLRQMTFATLDMRYHTTPPADIDDIAAFEDNAIKDIALFPRYAGPMSTTFSHIFAGGYSAGYYSYKWAEVLDADAFEAFKEAGLYDRETAERYKSEILTRGGTRHPAELYRNFRGRDADPDALLRREGLKKAS